MYLGEFFETIQEEHEIDPIDYDETMNDMDPHLRQRSTKAELEFVYSNQVWQLVETLEKIKSIRCKWVYKGKKWVNKKVETYKVRLVVKGCS